MAATLTCIVSGQGRLLKTLLNAQRINLLPVQIRNIILTRANDIPQHSQGMGIPIDLIDKDKTWAPGEFEQTLHRTILASSTDYLLLNFNRILPPEIVQAFPNRIINTHFSLLPAFPGMKPMDRACDSGGRFIGVTTHFINDEIDQGPIIAQAILPMDPTAGTEQHKINCFRLAVPLQLQTLAFAASQRLTVNQHNRVEIRGAKWHDQNYSPALEDPYKNLPQKIWDGVWP